MRASKTRKSAVAEQQAIEILRELAGRGALLPGGRFDRAVIREYLTTYRQRVRDEEERFAQMKVSEAFLEEELQRLSKNTPQRWSDTNGRFRDRIIFFSVKGDEDQFRDFTLWIGKSVIEASLRDHKPLAALLLKRLDERVKRAFPENQVGFWFNVERKPGDEWALHVHGVVISDDARIFTDRRNRLKLGKLMRDAAGEAHTGPARQLDMPGIDVDLGWWKYSMKQSRSRIGQVRRNRSPSLVIGRNIQATSHYTIRRTREFWDRARLIVDAVQTGALAGWTDDEWKRIEP